MLLIEQSEYALYKIHSELEELCGDKGIEVTPLLASVTDDLKIATIMQTFLPDTVYHAAAHKHVPLVEHNVCEGVKNNVFGTLSVATAARDSGAADFVLISTDKAVRPTNVMGASKRVAEMVLQAISRTSETTTFSMVRFGTFSAHPDPSYLNSDSRYVTAAQSLSLIQT